MDIDRLLGGAVIGGAIGAISGLAIGFSGPHYLGQDSKKELRELRQTSEDVRNYSNLRKRDLDSLSVEEIKSYVALLDNPEVQRAVILERDVEKVYNKEGIYFGLGGILVGSGIGVGCGAAVSYVSRRRRDDWRSITLI